MYLIHEKTYRFCGLTSMDITDKDQLLVRVEEGTKYWIRVMHRLTGDLINEFPSICDHNRVHVRTYPRYQDYVFENCPICEQIYAHNINTGECFSVRKGSKIFFICDGPGGSLLVKQQGRLHKLEWNKTQKEAQLVYAQNILIGNGKQLCKLHYVEYYDIFIYIVKDVKEDYEIIAVKLGSENIVWRLSGPVDGHIIKPLSMTCDTHGNAYVSDQATNRILKISSLTGEVLSILLFEEETTKIYSMRWSKREPNLTLRTKNQISTYFLPE